MKKKHQMHIYDVAGCCLLKAKGPEEAKAKGPEEAKAKGPEEAKAKAKGPAVVEEEDAEEHDDGKMKVVEKSFLTKLMDDPEATLAEEKKRMDDILKEKKRLDDMKKGKKGKKGTKTGDLAEDFDELEV
jgi:hypothetical protein